MIFKQADFITEVREKMRGGNGSAILTNLIPHLDIPNVRLFSLITLEQNTSVGKHVHENEAEIFYALYGSGTVTDNDYDEQLNQGDCHVCKKGSSHALSNTNEEPFVVLAAIITG